MKLYHPSAHFVDTDGAVKGFIIRSSKKSVPLDRARPISLLAFNQYVADGQMQLFEWGLDGPVLSLTKEDCKSWGTVSKNITTLEQYLASDERFYEYDILRTTSNPRYLALSLVYCYQTFGRPIVGLAMYREEPFTASELSYFKSAGLNTGKQFSSNIILVAGTWENIKSFLRQGTQCGYGINADTVCNTQNELNTLKLPLVKRASPAMVSTVVTEAHQLSELHGRASRI